MYKYYEELAMNIIPSLSDDQIEAIYRYKQMQYCIEDIMAHADDMYEAEEISCADKVFVYSMASIMAERYLYKYHDCNLAENDMMRQLILDFVKDHNQNP